MTTTITNMINRTLFLTGNTIFSLIISTYLMVCPCPIGVKILLLVLVNMICVGISTTCNINKVPCIKWAIFSIYSIMVATSLFIGISAYSFCKASPRTSSIIASNIKSLLMQKCLQHNTVSIEKPSGAAVLTTLLNIFAQASMTRSLPTTVLKKAHVFGYTVNFYQWSDLSPFVYELFSQKIYNFTTPNPHPYIIDCGSNIGMATLFFKMIYPNAKVLTFEPDPVTFATLEKNIADNHLTDVTAINKALLDRQGTIEFPQFDGSLCNPCASLYIKPTERASKYIPIPTDQLSRYIDRPVDFVKIDVEGAEGAIINDLDQARKFYLIKAMVIEYHIRDTKPSESLGSIIKTLEHNGFDVAIDGKIVPPFNKQQTLLLIYAKQSITSHVSL